MRSLGTEIARGRGWALHDAPATALAPVAPPPAPSVPLVEYSRERGVRVAGLRMRMWMIGVTMSLVGWRKTGAAVTAIGVVKLLRERKG